MEEINIYWNDLSDEGKTSMLDSGYILTKEIEEESKPVGVLHIGSAMYL